ncbi:hypothetical protein GCM10018952_71580 [Streptosporangium vulgare]
MAIRSGDTPQEERRRFATRPSDILITTPESLFLLLTSQAREALRGVETVIVDEVHAVAATKRGAHLALSLERLDALLPRPAQRIGLSATVRPVSEVAAFLGGPRPATVVQPPSDKEIEVEVVVPLQAEGQVRAALGGRHRVHLVDDDRLHAAQRLAGLAGEQQEQRLGGGDQDVGRSGSRTGAAPPGGCHPTGSPPRSPAPGDRAAARSAAARPAAPGGCARHRPPGP